MLVELVPGVPESCGEKAGQPDAAGREVFGDGDALVDGDVEGEQPPDQGGELRSQAGGSGVLHQQIQADTEGQGSEQSSLAPEAFIAGVTVQSALDLCFGKAGEQIQQDQGAADGADRAVVFRQSCKSAAEARKDSFHFSVQCNVTSFLHE